MKTPRLLFVAACALLAFRFAGATTVIPPTFDELVARAEVIFQGTVTNVRSQWTGEGAQRHIVSYITFNVEDPIKGEAGATYTLQVLGGTVGDTTMEVTDSPTFKPGDRDILFVEHNGTQFIPLVGIMHGRFRVQKDQQTGTERVTNDHRDTVSDLAQLGKEDHVTHKAAALGAASADQSPVEEPLRAADFKEAIKAKLAASRSLVEP